MIAAGSLPQVTKRIFLLCYGVLYVFLIAMLIISYYGRLRESHHLLKYAIGSITHYIEYNHEYSVNILESAAVLIAASKGDVLKVRDILDEQILQKSLPMRLAWSDSSQYLRVGTAVSVFQEDTHHYLRNYSVDLSDREYVTEAIKHPNSVYVSKILRHKITGRYFFPISIGVTDKQGHYLGCLANIIDQEDFTKFLKGHFYDNQLIGKIWLPNGEVLFSSQAGDSEFSDYLTMTGEYKLGISLNPVYQKQILQDYLIYIALVTVVTIVLFLLSHHYFAKNLSVPLQEMIHALLNIPMTEKHAIAFYELLPKIQQIQTTLADYHPLKQSLIEKEKKLREAYDLLNVIKQYHVTTMGSLSKELRNVFLAIEEYSNLLKEGLLSDSKDKKLFYDDHAYVEEYGLSLKFIANILHLLCQEHAGSLSRTFSHVDLCQLTSSSLKICDEYIEYKGLGIKTFYEPAIIIQDSFIMECLVDTLIFNACRFAQYGSSFDIILGQEETIIIHLHELNEEIFLFRQEPRELFVPSKRQYHFNDIQQILNAHINIQLMQSLASLVNGHVIFEPYEKQGIMLKLIFREPWNPDEKEEISYESQ